VAAESRPAAVVAQPQLVVAEADLSPVVPADLQPVAAADLQPVAVVVQPQPVLAGAEQRSRVLPGPW
jgi:hypothetical protein